MCVCVDLTFQEVFLVKCQTKSTYLVQHIIWANTIRNTSVYIHIPISIRKLETHVFLYLFKKFSFCIFYIWRKRHSTHTAVQRTTQNEYILWKHERIRAAHIMICFWTKIKDVQWHWPFNILWGNNSIIETMLKYRNKLCRQTEWLAMRTKRTGAVREWVSVWAEGRGREREQSAENIFRGKIAKVPKHLPHTNTQTHTWAHGRTHTRPTHTDNLLCKR